MKIASWQKESFIDYEGKISTLIFTSGCNYNCGYCHNPELRNLVNENIDEKEVLDYLKSKKGWIDAITISGGEPTIQGGLRNFIKEAKDLGFLVKLDTNGSRPEVLQELKNENLIDHIAMDIKGPVELYPLITGKFIDIRDDIEKGISLVSQFPRYEFRTTLVPIYENDNLARWMTPEEVGNAAKLIADWDSSGEKNKIRYFLQPFKAIEKEKGDKRFTKEFLPKEMWETPREYLEMCLVKAKKHIPNSRIR